MRKDVVSETMKLLESLSKYKGMDSKLNYGTYEDFVKYNKECDKGVHSKTSKFILNNIKYFIDNIRNNYEYVTDEPYIEGNWYKLQIVQHKDKYSVNYIYIEPEQKLWRIFSYGSEFYDPNSVPNFNV